MKTTRWFLFIFFAVVIGFYPIAYLLFDMSQGLLASKPVDVLNDALWKICFYLHISLGGFALLIGWSQFVQRWRNKYLRLHRTIGKIYLLSVVISGVSGLYIAIFASGGIIAVLGFSALAILWTSSTTMAYVSIRMGNTTSHEQWMIRSYALCFAAVTLRLWLPLFQFGLGMDFFVAYRIIAWLCWVPNLIVAEIMIKSISRRAAIA